MQPPKPRNTCGRNWKNCSDDAALIRHPFQAAFATHNVQITLKYFQAIAKRTAKKPATNKDFAKVSARLICYTPTRFRQPEMLLIPFSPTPNLKGIP